MVFLTLTLSFHEPYILNRVRIFDSSSTVSFFNDSLSREKMLRESKEKYLPLLKELYSLLEKNKNTIKINLSLSGLAIEQMIRYSPELLKEFQRLSEFEEVEFLSSLYYRSLSSYFSKEELRKQLSRQQYLIKKYFGRDTKIFHGPLSQVSLNSLSVLEEFKITRILYAAKGLDFKPFRAKEESFPNLSIFPISPSLSLDLSQNFYNSSWEEYPLRADTFASWIHNFNGNGEEINLELPLYSLTKKNHKSLLSFFSEFLEEIKKERYEITFEKLSDLEKKNSNSYTLEVPSNPKNSFSFLFSSSLQKDAFEAYLELGTQLREKKYEDLISLWRSLSCFDYIELMNAHFFKERKEEFERYYDSSYDVYLYFKNSLNHIENQMKQRDEEKKKEKQFTNQSDSDSSLQSLKDLVYE